MNGKIYRGIGGVLKEECVNVGVIGVCEHQKGAKRFCEERREGRMGWMQREKDRVLKVVVGRRPEKFVCRNSILGGH